MDAIVTDLEEYRKSKGLQSTAIQLALPDLTDKQITTRIVVMDKIENGSIVVSEIPQFMQDDIFPNGYDPEAHPEDNSDALKAEAIRRGVAPQ